MTKRRSITKAVRLRIWNKAGGICHLCKLPIHAERGEKWDVEHIIPLWSNGKDEESNMAPAHKDCHAPKTAGEASVRAKCKRIEARHVGATAPKQTIKSAGFPKVEKAPRNGVGKVDKSALPPLPRRVCGVIVE